MVRSLADRTFQPRFYGLLACQAALVLGAVACGAVRAPALVQQLLKAAQSGRGIELSDASSFSPCASNSVLRASSSINSSNVVLHASNASLTTSI